MANSPSVNNYSLGKGVVYFDRYDSNNEATGELDLGNAPVFSITPTVETLDHFESRDGVKEKDHSVNTSEGYTVKITLDEWSKENLNLAFRGADVIGTETQSDGTMKNDVITAHIGKWSKLQYRNVSILDVTDTTGLIHYVNGTDYTIDSEVGRIKPLSGGAIVEDQILYVDYNYDASSYPVISASTRSEVTGFLRFVGANSVGPKYEVEIWRVKLNCEADLNFISDDWGTIELTGEILKDTSGHPSDPWFKVWCKDENTSTPS